METVKTDVHSDRALLLLARNPTGARTGRIAVLESAVRGLRRAGADVEVVAITSAGGPDEWLGCPVTRVAPMGVLGMGFGAAKSVLTGRTLNEAVFDSRRIRETVRGLAEQSGASVVVADGLRTFDVARATGLPVISHLDDLLSTRYASSDFVEDNPSVLGYFGAELPGPVRAGAEKAVKALMGLEAKRARTSEVAVAKASAVTAMTSHEEAAELAHRSGRSVAFLPMGVEVAPSARPAEAPGDTAVFVGALHYGPNVAALRFLQNEVLPEIHARGKKLRIDVVGLIANNDISEFSHSSFHFTDYAPDLAAALAGHRMLLSPITAGTGVKTKALDGMSVELPVVGTTLGVAGIPVVDGESALIADSAGDFAESVIRLMDDPELARRIGQGGRRILETTMTNATVEQGWADAYAAAIQAGRR